MPHFHVVRLAEPDATPLEKRLTTSLNLPAGKPLAHILGAHITRTLAEGGQPDLEERLPTVFGAAFLTDRAVSSVLDIHRKLGADAFNRNSWPPDF
ncbi:hypothetical protein [Streptomyces sp. NPDC051636]|uniref:hypothetical protein n=1 Tax=Streptomyces sp. NPDC051636 TaxID=3365663 RepID=UPI0037B167AD